jgi:hypothetical protein
VIVRAAAGDVRRRRAVRARRELNLGLDLWGSSRNLGLDPSTLAWILGRRLTPEVRHGSLHDIPRILVLIRDPRSEFGAETLFLVPILASTLGELVKEEFAYPEDCDIRENGHQLGFQICDFVEYGMAFKVQPRVFEGCPEKGDEAVKIAMEIHR